MYAGWTGIVPDAPVMNELWKQARALFILDRSIYNLTVAGTFMKEAALRVRLWIREPLLHR